jgi:hypothetical protein
LTLLAVALDHFNQSYLIICHFNDPLVWELTYFIQVTNLSFEGECKMSRSRIPSHFENVSQNFTYWRDP